MPPKKEKVLGKSLIRDRFKGRRRNEKESERHTSELGDGFDWNKINLRSVTEETSIDEFLNTAQLAGTEFAAEKLDVKFISSRSEVGLISADERKQVQQLQHQHQHLLRIPRRPAWTACTSAEQLRRAEETDFLLWRRQLSELQEHKQLLLTPYERNLDFWRQLWRVVERSDVLVQIVDARNPLLYRCVDLEQYMSDTRPHSSCILLLNKADLLSRRQRRAWAKYFSSCAVKAVFFSAKLEAEDCHTIEEEQDQHGHDDDARARRCEEGSDGDVGPDESELDEDSSSDPQDACADIHDVSDSQDHVTSACSPYCSSANDDSSTSGCDLVDVSSEIVSRSQLIELLRHECRQALDRMSTTGSPSPSQDGSLAHRPATVGFVGYPNVGKSSTINTLLQQKRTSVSATPGKTKHFQTLLLDEGLVLCDCPGLVMPSFVATHAEMLVWGVLSVDQMRDHTAAGNYIASVMPRHVLQQTYGIVLPQPRDGECPHRPATGDELLDAYGFMRGFMTQRGLPDHARSARIIIKHFVSGKLLYCVRPPGISPHSFHQWPPGAPPSSVAVTSRQPPQLRAVKPLKPTAAAVDASFFGQKCGRSHSVSVYGVRSTDGIRTTSDTTSNNAPTNGSSLASSLNKPWREKSALKRNRKQKLRRVYRHLDE